MAISKLVSRTIPLPGPLTLSGHDLERVSSYRYLGVTLSQSLEWSDHITDICRKARRVLGLIYCQYSPFLSLTALRQLCISMVRPHLEYASQLWNPYLQKDIVMLESVQKFAQMQCARK